MAQEMSVPVEKYLVSWRSVLEPLLVKVEFTLELLTQHEQARVDALARPAPLGDPDDVPTAVAALILQAPVLTNDILVARAVYGPDFDATASRAYTDAFFGAGRALIMSEVGWAALFTLRLPHAVATAAGSGIRTVLASAGSSGALLAAATVSVAATAASPRGRDHLATLAPPTKAAIGALVEMYAYYRSAEQSFARLPRPSSLERGGTVERAC
ncbi:hypothetical protein [Nocardioides sp. 1609]|uniref:hypothetical protein n=1 Tax=Nocardioides sp. 1609 TaxID=2508327 RepID=UPI0010701205|nr:hypothetical protein [Nocardioides sp. 1609]